MEVDYAVGDEGNNAEEVENSNNESEPVDEEVENVVRTVVASTHSPEEVKEKYIAACNAIFHLLKWHI